MERKSIYDLMIEKFSNRQELETPSKERLRTESDKSIDYPFPPPTPYYSEENLRENISVIRDVLKYLLSTDPSRPPETQTLLARLFVPDLSQDTSTPLGKLMLGLDLMGPAGDFLKAVPLIAFHGTPHALKLRKAGRFDPTKIGTGEGHAAYGRGHYFAEKPDVAGQYTYYLGVEDFVGDESPRGTAGRVLVRAISEGGSKVDAIKEIERRIDQARRINPDDDLSHLEEALNILKSDSFSVGSGRIKVNLKVEPEQLLDWDLPLSKQPQEVKDKLRAALTEYFNSAKKADDYISRRSGADVIKGLGGAEIEPILKKNGILGVRYFDEYSRKAGWKVITPNGEEFYVPYNRSSMTLGKPDPSMWPKGTTIKRVDQTRNIVMFPGTEDLIELLDDTQ